uniref:Uncharacterized protein n=1 Tax=Vitis vinifera TaxID=29760 RepID=F6HPX8_VITVI
MNADAWGCPVMTPTHTPCSSFPQNPSGFDHNNGSGINNTGIPQSPFDLYPAEEVIDRVVKEAKELIEGLGHHASGYGLEMKPSPNLMMKSLM